MQIVINIDKKHVLFLAGILLIVGVSFSANALTQQEVLEQTPAFHLVKELYALINGDYVPLATASGKINASLIEGNIDMESKYSLKNADEVSANLIKFQKAEGSVDQIQVQNLYVQNMQCGTNGGTSSGTSSGGGITSIGAGAGLGKTTSGTSVTLYVKTNKNYGTQVYNDYVSLRRDCSVGQVLKWSGSSWKCANDNTGGGNGGGGVSSCSACDSRFVNEDGDIINGNLNMKDHDIKDVNTLEVNTLDVNTIVRVSKIKREDVTVTFSGKEMEINGYLDIGGYSFGYPQKGHIYARALFSRYVGVNRPDGVALVVFGSSPAIISNPYNNAPALQLGGDLNMNNNNIKNCGTSDCGDYIFRNQKTGEIAWILREGENNELEFYNSRGEKVMELDQEGNLKIKGTIQENWDFNE